MPRVKPPRPVLNRAHPLAKRLQCLFVPQDFGPVRDILVPSERLTLKNGARYDGAINCASAGDGAEMTTPTRLKLNPPITVAAYFFQKSISEANAGLFGAVYDNTGSSPYCCWQFYYNGVQYAFAFNNDAGASFRATLFDVGADSYVGQDVLLTATLADGSQTGYVNGVSHGTGSASVPSLTYAASSLIAAGNWTGVSRNSAIRFHFGAMWNRVLSAGEIASLAYDPFALYRPARRTVGKAPAAGFFSRYYYDMASRP